MSADLELRQQELLEIRLPPEMTSSEKASSQSSEITDEVDGIRSTNSSSGEQQQQGEEENNCQTPKAGKPSEKGSTSKKEEEEEEESGQCRTPNSPGNMIPVILSCPPAPKKQRTSVVSCKRKLVFFDQVVARDEIDSFFRQFAIDVVNSKRRCLV